MIQDLKEKLLEMLQHIDGLPADLKAPYASILDLLKHKGTVIKKDQCVKASVFIFILFEMGMLPMTNNNKKLVLDFSTSYLDTTKPQHDPAVKPARNKSGNF